jgi:hypothetical protein
MSLIVPTSEGGDGTFSGILWTYDLNGNEPVCRHATINDRAHFLGRDECFAYNKKRSEVLKENAKYGGKWRIPKMTTAETKVATPCVPQNQQHSNESQNYDNFEKCEEHKLEELANRIGARHEQPVYDEHESLKEHDDLKKQIAALSETLAVFRETIVDNTNCVGGIAHKLLMCERENKKSKDELKEALQKLEAAQFLLDEHEKGALQQLLDNESKGQQKQKDELLKTIQINQQKHIEQISMIVKVAIEKSETDRQGENRQNLEQVSNIVNAAGKVAIEKSETDRVRISDIVNDGKVAIEKCVSESSRINYTILILLGVGLLAQQYLLNVATLQSVREKALKTEPTYLSALTSILKGGLAAICDVARDSKSFNEALTLLQLSVKDDQCDEGGDICDTKVEIRGMKLIIKRMTVEMLEVLEALYRRTKYDGTVHGSCGQIVKRIDRTSAQLMLIKLQRPALIIIQAFSKCIKHSEISEEVFNNWYATLHNLETDVDQMEKIRGMISL